MSSAPERTAKKPRKGMACAACGSSQRLALYYLNGDHFDHRPDNVRTLCRRCVKWLERVPVWPATWEEALVKLTVRLAYDRTQLAFPLEV